MKFSELYRLLERDGWYIERTKKHHVYVHPRKPGTIPVGKHAAHKVPKGTLSSILKLANLNSR
jgi:predicted RNA binding protein YcfA (HicA-like mRNA interferase family)